MNTIRKIKDGSYYIVKVNGAVMPERYKSEDKAIAQAKSAEVEGYESSVIYLCKSGTYQSQMQVYPTCGNMYTN